MADSVLDLVFSGFNRIAFSIDSGASNSGEIDLVEYSLVGYEIQTTAGTAFTTLSLSASSTRGGDKRSVLTSTGGAISLHFAYDSAIGLSSTHLDTVKPWRYIQFGTTAASTAAVSGFVISRP